MSDDEDFHSNNNAQQNGEVTLSNQKNAATVSQFDEKQSDENSIDDNIDHLDDELTGRTDLVHPEAEPISDNGDVNGIDTENRLPQISTEPDFEKTDNSLDTNGYDDPRPDTACDNVTTEMQYLSFNPFHNQSFEASTIEPDTDRLDPHKESTDDASLGVEEISQSIGFVAENINQLIQESNTHIPAGSNSQTIGRQTPTEPPTPALIDPHCVKEVAKSSEKIVAAVFALLEVLQKQLHEMSALTTGYVQVHRDIGFKVTESVDDLLRALYSLISKIEQIDLKMTPVYELREQTRRLRTSLEQLDKLF